METRTESPNLMDRIRDASPMAVAVAALVSSTALLVIPLYGTSQLTLLYRDGYPLWERISGLLSIFSITIAIAVGIGVLNRGATQLASGIFIGIGVVLAFALASFLVRLVAGGATWETYLFLAFTALRYGLLFVAARRTRRDEHPAT